MTDSLQPTNTGAEIDPGRAPRTLTTVQMSEHLDHGRATELAPDRHAMFVRHAGTWWISDGRNFTEVTSPEQNRKLDRWHQRLTQGALWT